MGRGRQSTLGVTRLPVQDGPVRPSPSPALKAPLGAGGIWEKSEPTRMQTIASGDRQPIAFAYLTLAQVHIEGKRWVNFGRPRRSRLGDLWPVCHLLPHGWMPGPVTALWQSRAPSTNMTSVSSYGRSWLYLGKTSPTDLLITLHSTRFLFTRRKLRLAAQRPVPGRLCHQWVNRPEFQCAPHPARAGLAWSTWRLAPN